MTDRIIDISESGVFVHVRLGQLILERDKQTVASIPAEDLAVAIVGHPHAAYTNGALAALAAAGGVLVVCDERHTPAAMLIPLAANTTQTERIAAQCAAPAPKRKRLWQAVVQAKIRSQAAVLERLRETDGELRALAAQVKSGDSSNLEAQAARRYWPLLFDDPDFRRQPEGLPPNHLLNYGYGVLRAMAARAVCGAGLHPSIGIHHHNRYDAFCLADDLMEPFRPLVDEAVARIVAEQGMDAQLDPETKRDLIGALLGTVDLAGEQRTLFDALARLAASLAEAFAGKRPDLALPVF